MDGFWIDLGRVWGGFGCVLGEFGHSKLKLLRHMVISGTLWVSPAASHFATGTPALPRFASRSVTVENIEIFGFENFGPKLVRTDPERIPNGPRTDPERPENLEKNDTKHILTIGT